MNGPRRLSSVHSAGPSRKSSAKTAKPLSPYNESQKGRYKSYLFSPGVREKLIRLGFINRAGKVLTSLQEFNNYRMHLRKINEMFANRHKVSTLFYINKILLSQDYLLTGGRGFTIHVYKSSSNTR